VPVLISTGERDGHLNCCLIRTVRKIDDAATQGGALVTLVARTTVASTDAWGRVLATLKRDHRQPE
jgi:hypothetical protein